MDSIRINKATLWLLALAGALTLAMAMHSSTAEAAPNGSANISGTVGEIVDPDAAFGGFYLRFVGDPAPAGYSHNYQWGTPYIETVSPESEPVVFEGSLDLTNRDRDNSVAQIGLSDKTGLENGSTGFQRGASIYVNNRTNGDVRIGVSDGNAGGEIVQTFRTIPASVADAGPIGVTFTVDGTADPTTCEVPTGSGGTGCLTLEIDGFDPVSDSYGTIVDPAGSPNEFANGAFPGWEAFPAGASNVGYDLTVSPVVVNDVVVNDPQAKGDCKKGGFEDFGFRNQGQCVRFVQTGKDSR